MPTFLDHNQIDKRKPKLSLRVEVPGHLLKDITRVPRQTQSRHSLVNIPVVLPALRSDNILFGMHRSISKVWQHVAYRMSYNRYHLGESPDAVARCNLRVCRQPAQPGRAKRAICKSPPPRFDWALN